MPLIKFSLFVSFIVLLGYSCKKTDLNNNQGHRLVKTVYRWEDTLGFEFFTYDAEGKMVKIVDSNNNIGIYQTTFISYDDLGRVSNWQIEDSKFTFVYDDAGKIAKQVDTLQGSYGPYIMIHQFKYDDKNRIISDSTFNSLNNKLQQYTLFSYDDNDNLTRYQSYGIYQGFSDAQLFADNQFTYNSNSNPYLSLGIIYYFISNEPYLLSRHCVLTEKNSGSTLFFNYEYDNSSLTKKITLTDDHSAIPSTIDFFYE